MEQPPDRRDIAESTKMAGEMLAWLDEKTWTDPDKVAVTAGVLPVLMVRVSKDRATFEKIKGFFTNLIDKSSDALWDAKDGM